MQNPTGFDPQATQTINRFSWGKFFQKHGLMIAGVVVVLLVIGIVKTVHDKNEMQAIYNKAGQDLDIALKDVRAARVAVDDSMKNIKAVKAELEAKAAEAAKQPAKPVVNDSPKIRGTFAVVIGTLYLTGQRKLFKDESAAALEACSDSDTKLELVLAETGNTTRSRHETKALAASKQGMTEIEALAKADCLHEKLPLVVKRNSDGSIVNGDDGKPMRVKVVTEAVDGTKGTLAKAPVVHAEE